MSSTSVAAAAATIPAPKKAAGGHHDMPFHKHVIAGGTAGIVEILVMYPTDVLKTRAQLATEKLTMVKAVKDIMAKEGFGTFYRGIISPIFAEAPKRAIKFSTNETYKQWFADSTGKVSNLGATGAGALAGVTEAFFNCPFEVVKVRMQSKESKGLYSGTWDCFVKTYKSEGFFRGLYKGFEPQLWRNAVWNGTYFGVIGSIRNAYPAKPGATKSETVVNNLLTGSTAGALASCMNTPFDVVKSRMQNQKPGETKYRWAVPSLFTILNEEGPRNLYKGLGPRLLRLGPGGGIMIVAFDQVSEWIR